MPDVANLIELRADGKTWSLVIDGKPFPFATASGSVRVGATARSEMPKVDLTLLAYRVTVDHSVAPAEPVAVDVYDNDGAKRAEMTGQVR